MKLTENDIGKYFKTRDGSKVFFIGFDLDGRPIFETSMRLLYYVDEKTLKTYDKCNKGHDIIAPWPETKTIKGWVNVYEGGYMGAAVVYSTKKDADIHGCDGRIACKYIEITCTEGEGIND